MRRSVRSTVGLAAVALSAAVLIAAERPVAQAQEGGLEQLTAAFAAGGIELEPTAGYLSIEAAVATRDDLLEFLLVGTAGSAYESLLVTSVDATLLNAAMLALGVEQGTNARWVPIEGEATGDATAGPGELGARPPGFDVLPPEGPGFFVYVGWREGDEDFFYRAEDLVADLDRTRTLRRHRWVYLGSRMVETRDGEVFVAAEEQNYINIAWFSEGNSLLTSARPECERQDIWVGNPWLVPEPGTELRVFFSREPLTRVPAELAATLPISLR